MLQNNTTRHQPEDNPDGKSLNVQIFEHNHRKITDCMLNFIKQGVEPTQDDIARETGLSRKCVNEHFNNFDPKKERKKTLLMMEMLKPKIDMRISAQALNFKSITHPQFYVVPDSIGVNRPLVHDTNNVTKDMDGITIYPNPFDNQECFMELPYRNNEPFVFLLFDLHGKRLGMHIDRKKPDTCYTFNRIGLDEGAYILAIKYPTQLFYKKFVIIN